LPQGGCDRTLGLTGLGQTEEHLVMLIHQRRRDAIGAAVAAYDRANPGAPLPPGATRLLAAMFPAEDACRRNLNGLARDGFNPGTLLRLLRALTDAGLLSKERGSGTTPNTYRLHLPPRRQP
jgi:hypothetical protein